LFFVLFSARLNRLLKTSVARRVPPAAAKAGTENKAFIAAVNRCTTQKQDQNRVFQQTVKPRPWQSLSVYAADLRDAKAGKIHTLFERIGSFLQAELAVSGR
jgi:hypothetical protein